MYKHTSSLPKHYSCIICCKYRLNVSIIYWHWLLSLINWIVAWQNQQNECAPTEDSDQPGHPPSLFKVFAVRMKNSWVLRYPLNAQRRLWSDWADAQADLSLHWAHTQFVGFVVSRLIYILCSFTCHHMLPWSYSLSLHFFHPIPWTSYWEVLNGITVLDLLQTYISILARLLPNG